MLLNSQIIDALPTTGKREMFRDNEVLQLYIRVEKNGAKNWYFRGTNAAGTRSMRKLGGYPTMTVRAARREARQVVEMNKGTPKRFYTLQEMADLFLGDSLANLRDVRLYRSLTKYPKTCDNGAWSFFPDKPQDMTPQDVARYVDRLHAETTLADGTIGNMLGLLKKAFSYYYIRGEVTRNPVGEFMSLNRDLRGHNQLLKPTPPKKRYLDDAHVVKALETFEGEMLDYFKLSLLTGCRLEELRSLRYSEVDLENNIIRFPAERKKNRKPHELALCAAAQRIVSLRVKCVMVNFYLFPGLREFTPAAITGRYNRLMGRTPHDVRRTMSRDLSAGVKCPKEVISKIMSHTTGGDDGGARVTSDYTDDGKDFRLDDQRLWLEKLSKYYTEKYGI